MANNIDAGICERLINAATAHCASPMAAIQQSPMSPTIKEPNWDGVVVSLTSLSATFVWGSILLAVVVIALAIGWGYLVRGWAKDEATKVANEVMNEWLKRDAPKILREAASLLNPNDGALSSTAAQKSADEIGEKSG